MKKIITLCLFAFAMVLGTQSVKAQNIIDINAEAAAKTKELKQALKFYGDLEEKVYHVYQEYGRKKAINDKILAAGKKVPEEDVIALDNMLAERFKELFTPAQYERYLEVSKSPK